MSALGVWGDIVDAVKKGETFGDPTEDRLYAMSQPQESRDRQDGRRDALRVLAGKKPMWPLTKRVTTAYREGWEEAASCLG